MYAEEYSNKKNIIKKIIFAIIAIGIVIVICVMLFKPKKSNDFEKRILDDAATFVKINNITENQFITFYDMEQVVQLHMIHVINLQEFIIIMENMIYTLNVQNMKVQTLKELMIQLINILP